MAKKISVKEKKKMVYKAFAELRRNGFVAYGNFADCQTCGNYAVDQKVSEMDKDKKKNVKGYAFWHIQDEDYLKEYGELYISFGPIKKKKHEGIKLEASEVGIIVAETLRKHGLEIKWNGSEDNRILVK